MEGKNKVDEPTMDYGRPYTYADYLKMEPEERFEIIKGKIFEMSPAPARIHQTVSANLSFELFKYFNHEDFFWISS